MTTDARSTSEQSATVSQPRVGAGCLEFGRTTSSALDGFEYGWLHADRESNTNIEPPGSGIYKDRGRFLTALDQLSNDLPQHHPNLELCGITFGRAFDELVASWEDEQHLEFVDWRDASEAEFIHREDLDAWSPLTRDSWQAFITALRNFAAQLPLAYQLCIEIGELLAGHDRTERPSFSIIWGGRFPEAELGARLIQLEQVFPGVRGPQDARISDLPRLSPAGLHRIYTDAEWIANKIRDSLQAAAVVPTTVHFNAQAVSDNQRHIVDSIGPYSALEIANLIWPQDRRMRSDTLRKRVTDLIRIGTLSGCRVDRPRHHYLVSRASLERLVAAHRPMPD